jgi:hypothetical protein
MGLSDTDRTILRELAKELADIAALPIHSEKAELWRRTNDLDSVRPMVWITEAPWHEMNVDDELTLRTNDPWARDQEYALRKHLYTWRHMPVDSIPDPYIPSPMAVTNTQWGMAEDVEIVKTDEANHIVSRHFNRQIVNPEDVEKIQMAEVTHDEAATQQSYERMAQLYDGIMPVQVEPTRCMWFAPWDNLIRWWGVTEALVDMIARPEMVHAAMERMIQSSLHMLDQMDALNIMGRNDRNSRIGSGAYGYTNDLPGDDLDPHHAHPKNMWGGATAQIFSEVSPEMHWEFALKYEARWLERWGMTYYGCCEPLDIKMDILRRIPNLRKISMSPWVDAERAANEIGQDYVYSCKPNPAILAEDRWRPEQARKELREVLEKARGCHIEIVMKDISTVHYEPKRLWEWAAMAMEEARGFTQ